MPSQLAFILCIIFVVCLLRIDYKHAPKMSSTLWIPIIYMVSIGVKPLGMWFQLPGGTIEDGSTLDRIFQSILLCVGLIMLVRRRFNWSNAIKENACLFLLLCYMLVSIIWSDIPYIAFKRWVRDFPVVIMAFIVLTEPNPNQARECILRRMVYILIPFSLLLVKYYPTYGVAYSPWSGEQTWLGVTLHKNALGRLCLISSFFLIWSFIKRWQKFGKSAGKYHSLADIFVLSITLWLLLAGGEGKASATSIIALCAGLSIFVGLLLMKKYKMYIGANFLMAIIAGIIIFGFFTLFSFGSTVGGATSSFGRDETLTGRTDTWAKLIPVVMRQPILGYGFASFWTSKNREFYRMSNAHNGYLEVLLDLGFIGLFIYTIFFLSLSRKIPKAMQHDFFWTAFGFCFLLMVLIYNIAESSLNSFSNNLMSVLLLLTFSYKTAVHRT